jgi:transketolase
VGDGHDATVVLQGSEVAYAFVQEALPELVRQRIRVTAYYVASVELFDLLPPQRQEAIFPEAARVRAMGITGFTMPTLYRWVCSHRGRQHSLHPFREGHYMGSGPARDVVAQAGLDGASQVRAIQEFLRG